jgi:hypothetical protein
VELPVEEATPVNSNVFDSAVPDARAVDVGVVARYGSEVDTSGTEFDVSNVDVSVVCGDAFDATPAGSVQDVRIAKTMAAADARAI